MQTLSGQERTQRIRNADREVFRITAPSSLRGNNRYETTSDADDNGAAFRANDAGRTALRLNRRLSCAAMANGEDSTIEEGLQAVEDYLQSKGYSEAR